jgi:hypothetical protein
VTRKTDRLRGRLSIDPDAPAAHDEPSGTATPSETPGEQDQPGRDVEDEATDTVSSSEATPSPPRTRSRAQQSPSRAAISAVDDPEITPGRKSYRSFYLEDEAFARFRAAIYWCSRHPDALDEVPENMSLAIEDWMARIATDLEDRFNHAEVFRAPPRPNRTNRSKKAT